MPGGADERDVNLFSVNLEVLLSVLAVLGQPLLYRIVDCLQVNFWVCL